MTRTVEVTAAQVNAAKLKVKRSLASGRFVPPSVTAIANADGRHVNASRRARAS